MNTSKLLAVPSLQPHSRPHFSFRGCRGALLSWAASKESTVRPEKTASSRSSISVFSLNAHQSNSPAHSRLTGSTFTHGLSWSLPIDRLTLHTRGLALLAEKGMAPPPSGSAPAAPSGHRRRASHLRGPGRRRERRTLQRHTRQRRGERSQDPRPAPATSPPATQRPAHPGAPRCPPPPRAARKRKRGRAGRVPQAHRRPGRRRGRALGCGRKDGGRGRSARWPPSRLTNRTAGGGKTTGDGVLGVHRLLQ